MSKVLINIPYLEDSDVNPNGTLKPHVCKGKPVVLMVQGNFCGYCTQAKPVFQQFARSNPAITAVTIQTDGGPSDKGATSKISKVNSSPGVPAFLGFDSHGNFVAMFQGNRDVGSLQVFSASLK